MTKVSAVYSEVVFNFGFFLDPPKKTEKNLIWMRYILDAYSESGLQKLVDIHLRINGFKVEIDSGDCDVDKSFEEVGKLFTDIKKIIIRFHEYSSEIVDSNHLDKQFQKYLDLILDDLDHILETVELYDRVREAREDKKLIPIEDLMKDLEKSSN